MFKQMNVLLPSNKNRVVKILFQTLRRFSTEVEEIVIPRAIPRGPTDILKALSSTVHRDPTAAHFKYHDDPYLIPYSNLSKRSYSLSQEAGRKAAQWIRQEHADLFQHRVADPVIEAFIPKPVYDNESNVNEEILKNSILNLCVLDAITIYNLLKKKGDDISMETKQNLLELVCYYNENDPLNEDWIEERWFRLGGKSVRRISNEWNDGGFAEELFKEIGGNSRSISAIVGGMFKHGQLDNAWSLYEQATSKGIKLTTSTYNVILSKLCFMKKDYSMVMESLEYLMKQMEKDKIQPNVGTMNSILECLTNMSSYRPGKEFALSVISEFQTLGIKPSLATFHHLINIYSSDRIQLIGVMTSCLDYLEKNKQEIRDINDVYFFTNAMDQICHRIRDSHLARKLDSLLHNDNNYNFIGDSYKESIYYRNYFLLFCKSESLNTVMELYDTLVPKVYIPEPSVMNQILNAVGDNAAYNLLPRLWSDLVIFEQADRSSIFESVLGLAAKNTDESLSKALADLGWSMWETIENSINGRRPIEWTGPLLGDLMIVLLADEELNKANLVMDKLERLQNNVIGEPKIKALLDYVDACIKENSSDAAIQCIRYCNNVGFLETNELAKKLYGSLPLSEQQTERLISIVGEGALKDSKETET